MIRSVSLGNITGVYVLSPDAGEIWPLLFTCSLSWIVLSGKLELADKIILCNTQQTCSYNQINSYDTILTIKHYYAYTGQMGEILKTRFEV